MKTMVKKIKPDEFILSVLSPEDRIEAAFNVVKEAFKKSTLTLQDIDGAVKLALKRNAKKK